jgi:hypothetical protein
MTHFTQQLLNSAKDLTAQGDRVRLYFGNHTIVAKEVNQTVQGIIDGRNGAGASFEIQEEGLIGVEQVTD